MKFIKIFLSLFLCFGFLAKAQLDLEHWFPPYYRTGSVYQVSEIYFYLSTEKEDPFTVKVYDNNKVIKTFSLSKNTPVSFTLDETSSIYIGTNRRVMTAIQAGIHIAGEKSFYASLRLATGPLIQSPRITDVFASKGKSGLGKEFFTVTDQNILYGNTPDDMNYFVSVMATRDNTHVKLLDYNKDLVFSDGKKYDNLEFTLQKGESYIIAADKISNNPNGILDDKDPNLIGARISSDQPIVVSNGNFLSQNMGEASGNMNLDQTMPTSNIGKEYFLVNGMTKTEVSLEKILIVATKNNTKIYFNDETTPFKTLNKGEHFIGPYVNGTGKWIDGTQDGFTNADKVVIPTRGLFMRASQPVYVYQLIGGYNMLVRGPARDQTYNSSGMLFSYPLDKNYLPDPRQSLTNSIQIPSVSKIGAVTMDNKFSVKTEDNAAVTINGNPVTDFSPMPGKPGWSYVTRINYRGDVNIASNKSLLVDAVGGYRYAGFGSSYSGFSNDPFILKNGNCIEEGVFLYLNNTDFEGFQWKLNGVNVPGANGPTITPQLPGNYTCVLSYMDFTFTTNSVLVENCPYSVVEKNEGRQCHRFSTSPAFSPVRPRDEIVSTQILTQPLQGKATIIDGVIFIDIDDAFSGDNRIVYEIKGESGFKQTVKLSFFVNPIPTADIKESIFPKSFRNRSYVYDLTDAVISNPDGNVIKYFQNKNQKDEITGNLIKNFTTNITEIYAVLRDKNGCALEREISLLQNDIPDQPGNPEAALPNFFTPNDDGLNDVWDYTSLGNMTTLQLAIFDRFGTKLYEHNPANKSNWDGKSDNGVSYPSGTYWVYYIVIDETGAPTKKSQWIHLRNYN